MTGTSSYPQRIVSLGPVNTENVYLLGAGDRLMGDTIYCVRPEEAKRKVKVGTMLDLSVEKIISLQPDLILATGLTPPDLVQQLQHIGLRVEKFEQPSSFAESCQQFLKLGSLLGLKEKAQTIVEQARTEVQDIQNRVGHLPPQKVLLQIGSQPLFASINGTFPHDFIRLTNAINIVADQTSGRTDYERVIADNPDVILIAIMGSETGNAKREQMKWQRYPSITAVRDNRIFIIDPDMACSPSPATFAETLLLVAAYIHPNAYLEDLH